MDDAYGYEERSEGNDEAQITASGNYLCVQHEGQLRYIYRRVSAGIAPHTLQSYTVYKGDLYGLAWVEGDD